MNKHYYEERMKWLMKCFSLHVISRSDNFSPDSIVKYLMFN